MATITQNNTLAALILAAGLGPVAAQDAALEPDAFRFVHILHLRSSLYIPLRCRFREVGRWLR